MTTAFDAKAHQKRNAALLQQLAGLGVDLHAPRPIDFHFWIPEDEAHSFAGGLRHKGYEVELSPSDDESGASTRSATATALVSPETASSDVVVLEMIAVAKRFGGVFDGWGTSV